MLKQKTPKPERRVIKTCVLPGWLHPDTSAAVRAILRQRHISTFTVRFSKGERAVCRRRPPVPVSRWAERHRVLHLSSRPGRWRNAVTQYTSGIMDASFFPSVRTIVIIKCPQSGGTEAVHNCVGYAIDRAPGPVLYVYPDEATARENAQDRIIPMLRASRRLSEYISGTADDVSSLRINLTHMTLHMAWSGSASRLGNKPIRYLVLDELDKYQQIKKEASSEALAEKRVTTWGKRARIWKISTPTVVNGPIDVAFKSAEARYRYFAICPYCGAELLMEFERICWPQNMDKITDPVTLQSRQLAWYACQHCEAHWTDADRDKAVRMGLWREEVSGMALTEHLEAATPMSVGFHVPAWISPFVSLSEVAAKALVWQSTQDMNAFKDLQNNYKAEPWEEQYEVRTEDAILALCDDRPRGVLPGPLDSSMPRISCLLASVDTQLRYYRYVIRAFGFGETLESWLVQEGVAPTLEVLDQLFWHNEYRDPAGTPFKVTACIIDAMGHPERTSGVIAWAAANRGRVFPSQGVHAPSTPVGFAPREYFVDAKGHKVVIPGGVLLHKIDTTLFKGELANALTIAPSDPGAFHLHSADEGSLKAYAKEMTAEVWNSERGLWDNPGKKPNHAWDCEYLLRGLAWMLGVRNMVPPNADDDGPEYIPQPSNPGSSRTLGRARRR